MKLSHLQIHRESQTFPNETTIPFHAKDNHTRILKNLKKNPPFRIYWAVCEENQTSAEIFRSVSAPADSANREHFSLPRTLLCGVRTAIYYLFAYSKHDSFEYIRNELRRRRTNGQGATERAGRVINTEFKIFARKLRGN